MPARLRKSSERSDWKQTTPDLVLVVQVGHPGSMLNANIPAGVLPGQQLQVSPPGGQVQDTPDDGSVIARSMPSTFKLVFIQYVIMLCNTRWPVFADMVPCPALILLLVWMFAAAHGHRAGGLRARPDHRGHDLLGLARSIQGCTPRGAK